MMPGQPVRPLSPEEIRATFEQAIDGGAATAGSTAMRASAGAGLDVGGAPGLPLEIGRLMALPDHEFIDHAYRSLLNRSPDEAGLQNYMNLLTAGTSRVAVLGGLRYSPEGVAVGRPVPGLRKRYLIHRLYGIRGFGHVLRSLTGLFALPGLLRDQAKLGREVHALQTQLISLQKTGGRVESMVAASQEEARFANQHVRDLGEQITGFSRHLQGEPWAKPILELGDVSDRQAGRIEKVEEFLLLNPNFTADMRALGQFLEELHATFDVPEGGAVEALKRLAQDHRNLSAQAVTAAEDAHARLRDQEQRLSLILEDLRKLAADRGATEIGDRAEAAQADLLDPLYVAFEDRFRGARADIKQRQRVYLDILRDAGAGTPERPILDVGSGRGELLELLGDEGLVARGVDLNVAMVELCRSIGLDSIHADAVAHLRQLEPGSLGAVTGFHIIEHLPFRAMVALLDASLRALAPGGLIIFETPNPANLLVASRWFYLDPTHRNPLPGEMVAMIAEARGFVQVGIRELHPMQARFAARDEVLAAELDRIFHGPQDYALIARKAS